MYCTAHRAQASPAPLPDVQLGLLLAYWMELEMSLPCASSAYAAQSTWDSASRKTWSAWAAPGQGKVFRGGQGFPGQGRVFRAGQGRVSRGSQ